jgi:hypothetical protein
VTRSILTPWLRLSVAAALHSQMARALSPVTMLVTMVLLAKLPAAVQGVSAVSAETQQGDTVRTRDFPQPHQQLQRQAGVAGVRLLLPLQLLLRRLTAGSSSSSSSARFRAHQQ